MDAIEAYRGRPEVHTTSAHSYFTEPVAFTRHLQGRAVLDLVWREHRDAGELLVEWLRQTPAAHQSRADRAGFILGQLVQWSSGRRALDPIEQLAHSDRAPDWRMAARAFGGRLDRPRGCHCRQEPVAGMVPGGLRVTALHGGTDLCHRVRSGAARGGAESAAHHHDDTGRRFRDGRGGGATGTALPVRRTRHPATHGRCPRPLVAFVRSRRPHGVHGRRPAAEDGGHGQGAGGVVDRPPALRGPAPGAELIRSALMEPTSYEAARDALLEWQRRAATDPRRAHAVEQLTGMLARHLRGGVFRLFTDLERAMPAPGAQRAAQALAQWRHGTLEKGHA
ncbi:hypothetical protein GCM10020000_11400 [Streptomyces olivoverticillatus]